MPGGRRRRARNIGAGGRLLLALMLALLGMAALAPRTANAHPLGNFTVNRYARIEVYRDVLRVQYVLDLAEIPSFQEMPDLDPDSNGASTEELEAWAQRRAELLRPDLLLEVDGVAVPLRLAAAGGASAPGQSNLPVLRLSAVYDAAVPEGIERGASVEVRFEDRNLADRLGWRELVVSASKGAEVDAPRGYLDRSNMLRAYPASSLTDAPDERDVSLSWVAGTGETAPAPTADAAPPAGRGGGFESLLSSERSPLALALTMVVAAGFGMAHAFGPGHGKAIVAAYLVGNRGTARHAVGLGLTVTATHTAAVYLLGGVTLVASQFVVPEDLYLSLSVVSGVLVMAFGATLLARRVRPSRAHVHSEGGHDHTHPHPHERSHLEDATSNAASWRSVLMLGMVGGMLPCPSAIVVMLAAIALGEVVLGMLLIVAFSVGLASVLTGLGLAIVLGRRFTRGLQARHQDALDRLRFVQRTVYIASPLAITVIGLVLTLQALRESPIARG